MRSRSILTGLLLFGSSMALVVTSGTAGAAHQLSVTSVSPAIADPDDPAANPAVLSAYSAQVSLLSSDQFALKTRVTQALASDAKTFASARSVRIDPATGHVLVEVDRDVAALTKTLQGRLGTTHVRAVLSPDAGNSLPNPAKSRNGDTSPWSGGARITTFDGSAVRTCTTGFPYKIGTYRHILTAGHCVPNGGRTSTSVKTMGSTTSGDRENWNLGVGTVAVRGRPPMGDLALVTTSYSGGSSNQIYVGPPGSATMRTIQGVAFTHSGDTNYCTGGTTTGELCGWKVTGVFTDQRYVDGTWVRNVATATKPGICVKGGDSGGPVYTRNSTSGVIAHGIISGGGGGGKNPCTLLFTDVWRARDLWGGYVRQ